MSKNIFNILNWAGPDGNVPEKEKSAAGNSPDGMNRKKELSNQDIHDYVTEHFRTQMKKKSLSNALMFPMSFTVILNKADYDEFKGYSQAVSQLIVQTFYKVIKEEQEADENKICMALATYWNISFLRCDDEPMDVNDKMVKVERGRPYICSTVHDKLIEQVKDSGESGSTFTVSQGGSQLYANVNINRETLDTLRLVGETHFQIDWDSQLSTAQVSGESYGSNNSNDPAKAEIRTQGKVFKMKSGTYIISGNKEARSDKNIFRVNSDFVENGHLQLQYIESEQRFKMAAYADFVTLNDEPVPVSTANDKIYMDLEDGDEISIFNNDVIMNFRTIKQ